MRNPFWRLKTLPWILLLQNAGLTISIATLADILLYVLLSELSRGGVSAGMRSLLTFLVWPLPLLAAFGIGALAVWLLEKFFTSIYIDTAILWALVPCIGLILLIKGMIPQIPTAVVSLSYPQLVGVTVGVFVKGRRHWRY